MSYSPEFVASLAAAKSPEDVQNLLDEYNSQAKFRAIVEKCANLFKNTSEDYAIEFISNLAGVAESATVAVAGKAQKSGVSHRIGFDLDNSYISLIVTVKGEGGKSEDDE